VGTSEALWATVRDAVDAPQTDGYKADFFDRYVTAAEDGDPAAISTLPKFVTSVGQLATTLELTLDNQEAVTNWRSGREHIQFIGSFNPQHVGHRATIRSTLDVAGERSSGMAQVVENHPIKKDSLPPYRGRFTDGERKLYASTLLDPTRVTQLDVPLGLGLAKQGVAQIALLAEVTGDSKLRWLMGSDKFMTDTNNVRAGKALDKAGVRFADERVHLYVARRDTHEQSELDAAIDYLGDRYGTTVTMVPESPEPIVLGAAGSKIRALRAEGQHSAADYMEYYDLPDLRPAR
jgi:hypothetical protein